MLFIKRENGLDLLFGLIRLFFSSFPIELIGILNHPKINGKGLMSRIIIRNRNLREGVKKVRITEQAFERMINDMCKE